MLEKELEEKIRKYVKSKGGLFWKFVSPGTRGVPDRLCILPQVAPFFMEIKKPGEKLRPEQVRTNCKLSDRGARVFAVDNLELAKRIIDELGTA